MPWWQHRLIAGWWAAHRRYAELPAEDKWLFAGIKVGWEASIGWNAYYYPGGNTFAETKNTSHDPCMLPYKPGDYNTPAAWCHLNKSAPGAAWGMVQLGYAAAASAGLTPSGGGGTLSRTDIASLVQMYLRSPPLHVVAVPSRSMLRCDWDSKLVMDR